MFLGRGAYFINIRSVCTTWELRGFPLHGKQLWGAWPAFALWRVRHRLWSCTRDRCTGWVPVVVPEDSPGNAKKGSSLCSPPLLSVQLLINDFAYYRPPHMCSSSHCLHLPPSDGYGPLRSQNHGITKLKGLQDSTRQTRWTLTMSKALCQIPWMKERWTRPSLCLCRSSRLLALPHFHEAFRNLLRQAQVVFLCSPISLCWHLHASAKRSPCLSSSQTVSFRRAGPAMLGETDSATPIIRLSYKGNKRRNALFISYHNGRYLNKQPHKMNLVAARRVENRRSRGISPTLRAQETGQNGITQAMPSWPFCKPSLLYLKVVLIC